MGATLRNPVLTVLPLVGGVGILLWIKVRVDKSLASERP